MSWHFIKSGTITDETIGPLSDDEFLRMAEEGTISPATKVAHPSHTKNQWVKVQDIPAYVQRRREARENRKQEKEAARQAARQESEAAKEAKRQEKLQRLGENEAVAIIQEAIANDNEGEMPDRILRELQTLQRQQSMTNFLLFVIAAPIIFSVLSAIVLVILIMLGVIGAGLTL